MTKEMINKATEAATKYAKENYANRDKDSRDNRKIGSMRNFNDYKKVPTAIQRIKCFFGFHVPRGNICCSQCDDRWYSKNTNCIYCNAINPKKTELIQELEA